MDKNFQNKAKCLRGILNILSSDDNTTLKIIEFVKSQPDFTVTQTDIAVHLQGIPSGKIYGELVKTGIVEESNTYGKLSETVKKGRAMKKYYRINKNNWDKINFFITDYDGCK